MVYYLCHNRISYRETSSAFFEPPWKRLRNALFLLSGGETMKDAFLTCRLPSDDMQILQSLATNLGVNRSEALRRVIRQVAKELGVNGKSKEEVKDERL